MKWRVLSGWRFKMSDQVSYGPGEVFEAQENKVAPYRWMVEPVIETPKAVPPPPPPEEDEDEDADLPKVNRAERKRNPRAYERSPTDRMF